jgi:hypothetical protein
MEERTSLLRILGEHDQRHDVWWAWVIKRYGLTIDLDALLLEPPAYLAV